MSTRIYLTNICPSHIFYLQTCQRLRMTADGLWHILYGPGQQSFAITSQLARHCVHPVQSSAHQGTILMVTRTARLRWKDVSSARTLVRPQLSYQLVHRLEGSAQSSFSTFKASSRILAENNTVSLTVSCCVCTSNCST